MIDKIGNKRHSAHFTDVDVATAALDKALEVCPELRDRLHGRDIKFLDPCCGSGALTEAAIGLMRKCRVKTVKVTAVEYQDHYVDQYHQRLRKLIRPKS